MREEVGDALGRRNRLVFRVIWLRGWEIGMLETYFERVQVGAALHRLQGKLARAAQILLAVARDDVSSCANAARQCNSSWKPT